MHRSEPQAPEHGPAVSADRLGYEAAVTDLGVGRCCCHRTASAEKNHRSQKGDENGLPQVPARLPLPHSAQMVPWESARYPLPAGHGFCGYRGRRVNVSAVKNGMREHEPTGNCVASPPPPP
jgi:hypothetical protein